MIKSFKRYFCPVCSSKIGSYNPLPKMYAENAEKSGYKYFGKGEMTAPETYSCSTCGASDRERLYSVYIRKTLSSDDSSVFFHFAPEPRLKKMIQNEYSNINYKTLDLLSSDVDINADLTDLSMISDNECDFFICSHVLEHVNNDIKAIEELYRILRPGGKGILMAPICLTIDKTIENVPEVKTDADRWKYYGQNDHARLYAKQDYIERIKQSGFDLQMLDINHFGRRTYKKLGLKTTSVLYIVEKDG